VKSDLYIKILHFQQPQELLKFHQRKSPFSDEIHISSETRDPKKIANVIFPLNVLFLNLALISNEMKNPSLSNLKVLQNQFIGFSIIFDFVNNSLRGVLCYKGAPFVAQTDYRTTDQIFELMYYPSLFPPTNQLIIFIQVNQG